MSKTVLDKAPAAENPVQDAQPDLQDLLAEAEEKEKIGIRENLKKQVRRVKWRKVIPALIVIAIIILILFSKCEPDGWRSSIETGIAQPNVTNVRRQDIDAKPFTLGAGSYIVGKDIEPGRYVASVDAGYGGFVIYDNQNYPEISEVLGNFADVAAVPNITCTLVDGYRLEITKLSTVHFKPVETVLLTTLTTGVWEVGRDILPGEYTVTTDDTVRAGYAEVLTGDLPVANHKINGKKGINSFRATLEDGQMVRIGGIASLIFTAV